MKKIDEIKNQEWYLGESELERIKFIIEELTFFTTHKKIIQNLEDLINDRIINLLKQHHMID
jgi:hypothetical protein